MSSIVDVDREDLRGVPVVRITGEIDLSVVGSLEKQLRASPPEGAPGMILDLSELEYLDSSGLRFLFEVASRLDGQSQRLRLVVTEGSLVGNLMKMTQAGDIVPVDHNLSDAVDALASQHTPPG